MAPFTTTESARPYRAAPLPVYVLAVLDTLTSASDTPSSSSCPFR